jgi:hypothetical protein
MVLKIGSINAGFHWTHSWWAGDFRGSALRDGNLGALVEHLALQQPDIQFVHQVRNPDQMNLLHHAYGYRRPVIEPDRIPGQDKEYVYLVSHRCNSRHSTVFLDHTLGLADPAFSVESIPVQSGLPLIKDKEMLVVQLKDIVVASVKLTAGLGRRAYETEQVVDYLEGMKNNRPVVLIGSLNYVVSENRSVPLAVDRKSMELLSDHQFIPLLCSGRGTTRGGRAQLDYAYVQGYQGRVAAKILSPLPEVPGIPPIASRPIQITLHDFHR